MGQATQQRAVKVESIGKSALAAALGWSRPTLDQRLATDSHFPVVERGDRGGGWAFDLSKVRAYLAGPPVLSRGPAWYVVVAVSGQERLARVHLERQGFEVYLPMRLHLDRNGDLVAKPFLPRHMFVRMDLLATLWRPIISTIGVRKILLSGDHPMWIDDKLIDRMKDQEEGGFIKVGDRDNAPIACRFDPGQKVRVKSGPFEKLEGAFFEPIDENRVAILLSICGRDSRVILDPEQLTEST